VAGIAVERRRADEQAESARREAEAASRAKSEFLANMSHEVRTPLTAILGYADLLPDPRLEPAERSGYVDIIRQNGQHLLSVINDILDISKIESGKMTVERIPCSPHQVVEQVAALLRGRAKEKNLQFIVEQDGPIPATIQSDPTRLRQILFNLAGNAIKFTEAGSVRLVMNLLPLEDTGAGQLCFEVIDTGIGMGPGQKARLFQPFSQGDGSTLRRYGGTGLGLVIAKRLAELLGGGVHVQTEETAGTSFIVWVETGPLDGVPLLERPDAPEAASAVSIPEPPEAASRLAGRVLLAEDVAVNRKLITLHLTKVGADVEAVGNGREAVEKVRASMDAGLLYDLVLMDLQMPVMDGFEATAQLRQLGYRGPIIALTAHAMAEYRERVLAAGCDDYLTKPIQRGKLLEVAARHLGVPATA
jgi:Amt family ammonium transporter